MDSCFKEGDFVLLVNQKGKSFILSLARGSAFHCQDGVIKHDDVLKCQPGQSILTSTGALLRAFVPTLSERIMKFKRGAQIIYPKDIAMILIEADIYPGITVLEAGVGSGALSFILASYGAKVTGYEIREDFYKIATLNLERFSNANKLNLQIINDDVRNVKNGNFQRIVLDLPSPWDVIPEIASFLVPGGIIICFLPNLNQVKNTALCLKEHGFTRISVLECLTRNWLVDEVRLRPELIMRGHSGFITKAFKLG
jgi:tRNA (adenine57-N1/adenine58-N1)-methyltransferase